MVEQRMSKSIWICQGMELPNRALGSLRLPNRPTSKRRCAHLLIDFSLFGLGLPSEAFPGGVPEASPRILAGHSRFVRALGLACLC